MGETTLDITICMGSSCYSRGNNRSLEAIREYIAQHGITSATQVVGHLCQDQCRSGPNIRVNQKLYSGVDPAAIVTIMREAR